jgi:hypothetical protein
MLADDKISLMGIVIFVVFFVLIITSPAFLTQSLPDFISNLISLEISYSFEYYSNVDKVDVFNTFSDVSLYPHILPKNILDIRILNSTENVKIVESTIIESGIKTTMKTKHTLFPYDKQIIEVLNGDAKGSKIILNFADDSFGTNIDSKINLITIGPLKILVSLMDKNNFESAFYTIMNAFVLYTNSFSENLNQKTFLNSDSIWSKINLVQGGLMNIDHVGHFLFSQEKSTFNISNVEFLNIDGWAIDTLSESGHVNSFLIFQNNNSEIIIITEKTSRPDVSNFFNVERYESGGWEATIDTKEFEDGCYDLLIRVLRTNGLEYFEINSDKQICFN